MQHSCNMETAKFNFGDRVKARGGYHCDNGIIISLDGPEDGWYEVAGRFDGLSSVLNSLSVREEDIELIDDSEPARALDSTMAAPFDEIMASFPTFQTVRK